MISDELGQELHDKATVGKPLTSPEREKLEDWYRQRDAQENHSVSGNEAPSVVSALRSQLRQTLDQIKTTAQQIQELANTNELLWQENTALRERLARSSG